LKAQVAAFRAWEAFAGARFAKLRNISQPCLVVKGVFDQGQQLATRIYKF